MRKETDRSSYLSRLGKHNISASLVSSSRSRLIALIATRRCSSNSSPARSQRSGSAMGSAAAPNPSLADARLSSNVSSDQRRSVRIPAVARPEAGHPSQGDHPGEAVRRATLISSAFFPPPSSAQWLQLRAARPRTSIKSRCGSGPDAPSIRTIRSSPQAARSNREAAGIASLNPEHCHRPPRARARSCSAQDIRIQKLTSSSPLEGGAKE